jgi:high affinity Mn2+ porin
MISSMESISKRHLSIFKLDDSATRHIKLTMLAIGLIAASGLVFAEALFNDGPRLVAESFVSDYPKILSSDSFQDTENWSVHGQATYVTQQKNNFTSSYYGPNSLLNKSEGGGANSFTLSSTAFLGARLWHGGEFYYNPEMFEGKPFTGQLVGLGGFQNGELQKGSFANPVYYTARAFFRQTIGLGGETQNIESSANQLAGRIDQNRLVLSLGKFATLDFFDQNSYSHDPRTQFETSLFFLWEPTATLQIQRDTPMVQSLSGTKMTGLSKLLASACQRYPTRKNLISA